MFSMLMPTEPSSVKMNMNNSNFTYSCPHQHFCSIGTYSSHADNKNVFLT